MGHLLKALALAPVLLAQGLYVRRTIPRLPEPPGPRQGRAGDGPRLRLLIAGDSAAAGVGAAAQSEALAGRLVEHLAGDFRVAWRLIARTGATTRDTLDRLGQEAPATFDAVVTSLGVNDLVAGASVRGWIGRQAELTRLLRRRFGARRIVLSGLPPVARFPALPQPLRGVMGARSRRFDRALASWAQTQDDCDHLPLDFAPDTGLMASDGFHPGPGVYAFWGREAAGVIRERFS